MAFAFSQFVIDIKASLNDPVWSSSATKLATAIDTFWMTGEAQTTVTAVVTPPPPAPPYPATGEGKGNPVSTGIATLTSTIISAFAVTLWSVIAGMLAPALELHVQTSTLTTNVTGAIRGTGTKSLWITATGLPALTTNLNLAFTTGTNWDQTATDIATAIEAYFKSIIINTIDGGTVPPNSWAGTGIGNLV